MRAGKTEETPRAGMRKGALAVLLASGIFAVCTGSAFGSQTTVNVGSGLIETEDVIETELADNNAGTDNQNDQLILVEPDTDPPKYTGFQNINGDWYYVTEGEVDYIANGLIKSKLGPDAKRAEWWYVVNGKVQFIDTIASNEHGTFAVINGRVNFEFTGFVFDGYNWYYAVNGRVSLTRTGLYKGKVNGETAWWYVENGRVTYKNCISKNETGYYAVINGKVDFTYTGFMQNDYGWWYAYNGKINQKATGLYYGWVNGTEGWWYIVNSKVHFVNSVVYRAGNWYAVRGGRVDYGYNGFASNDKGTWLCFGGMVNFSYNGEYTEGGVTYLVRNGRLIGTVEHGNEFDGPGPNDPGNDFIYEEDDENDIDYF